MTLIEKYLFRQILAPVLAAVAALTAVGILSQSLSALDIIVERGQSAWVLIKVTLLALPQLLNLILPIAIFVGGLLALNRLQTDQELVVCSAGGMSRWRVISPAIRMAMLFTLFALVVNLWIQPLCYRAMREELFKVKTDLAATLVREGEFTEAGNGLTVYTQSVDQNGLLKNLFIHVQKPGGGVTAYTAQEGRIAKRDGQPALILRHGSSQEFSSSDVLNYLSFDEYVFDLSRYLRNDEVMRYKSSDRFVHELFFPQLKYEREKREHKKNLAEGHARIASPLYNLAFMALALAGVLGGSFSRTGYGGRIAKAAAVAAVVRILGFAVQAAAASTVWVNVLQYLVPLAPIAYAYHALFRQRIRRYVPLVSDQQPILPRLNAQ